MKKLNLLLTALCIGLLAQAQNVANFENLTLAADTFWNGSDLSGGFNSGQSRFYNNYDTTYSSWSGFAYSDKTDTLTAGISNQYSAVAGSGYNGSAKYAVGDDYGQAKVYFPAAGGASLNGVYVTNNTYAYLSMKNGDNFAKKFGGVSGNDQDWFKLTIAGWHNGTAIANKVDFYLADYRFSNNSQDYIVKNWQWVDLTSLGIVDSIQFTLTSSDTGAFGMNTPAFFCIDNLVTNAQAPVVSNVNVVIPYTNDTLLHVLTTSVFDTTGLNLTVTLLSSPQIPGASAVVDNSGNIWYIPATGIVAKDTLTFQVCDEIGLCATGQVFFDITSILGIDEVATTKLNVYPNPFVSELSIYHNNDAKEISLLDLTGKEIMHVQCLNGAKFTSIPLANLAAGSYLVKILTANGTSVARVVKQ